MLNEDFFTDEDDEDLVLTEDESDTIINNLKDELIMESINEQIKDPLNNSFGNADYLDIFTSRYQYLSECYKDSPSFIKKLNDIKELIYNNIFESITQKFNLSYNLSNINIIECASNLYYFFVIDYKQNLIDYILNDIFKNKKSILLSLQEPKYTKNLTINALKKVLKNKDDAIIISNILSVVDSIIKNDKDNLDVISDICKLDIEESNNYSIYQYFLKDFSLAPNKDFNNLFFKSIINRKEGFAFIVNEIKMELLENAPKKN